MKPEVAVMYGNRTIVRVPWEDKLTLARTDVLAITIVNNRRPRDGLREKREQLEYEHDFYTLCWKGTH